MEIDGFGVVVNPLRSCWVVAAAGVDPTRNLARDDRMQRETRKRVKKVMVFCVSMLNSTSKEEQGKYIERIPFIKPHSWGSV